MIVEGGVVAGDTRFMLRCMVEELLRGGMTLREIDALARDANYQALFAARETLGDDAFSALLASAAVCVGVHSYRIRETPATTLEAALTLYSAVATEKEPVMSPACSCHATHNPDAVEFLKQEHRVIETVLDALEFELAQRGVTPAFMWPALEFLGAFADGCHHHKEEKHLFPRLEECGVPHENGPIGRMLSEHDTGRALMKRMRTSLVAIEAGECSAEGDFSSAATQYIEHLRQHIAKEDNVLFVMAERVLSGTERAQMAGRFYDFERCGDRPGTHDRFVALAKSLYRRAFGESRNTGERCSHAGSL